MINKIWFKRKTIELPHDPAVLVQGMYQSDSLSDPRDSCTFMFTAVLVTTAQKKMDSFYMSITDEWVMKL